MEENYDMTSGRIKLSRIIMALPIILVPVLFLLDKTAKNLAVLHLKGQNDLILIENVLQLRYIENRGAAFGILQNSRWFFIVITLLVTAGAAAAYIWYVVKRMTKRSSPVIMLLFSLLMAGAFGNFADRAANGYVVDFIYVSLIDFPVFNLADIYITCGCILTILYIILTERKNESDI